MIELPIPCYYCRVRARHNCFLQTHCAKVKRYYQHERQQELNQYQADVIERYRRRRNLK